MFYMSSFREVAMQPVLDQQKLKTLVYYIEVVQHFALPFPFPWIFSSFVKVLLNYLPGIRDPVRKFLVSLRDWPVGKNFDSIKLCLFFKILILIKIALQVQMGYSSLPHTLYKKKVEELLELHRPFSKTPMEWQGCKGSSPQYRGYPCSLW